jgi:hypothetical protein
VALVLVLMTGLVVANAGIGALGSYVLRRTAESVVLAARLRLVDRLLGLRISAVDRAEPGDLMSRVTADTTLLRDVTADSLVGGVTGTLMLLATLALMGYPAGRDDRPPAHWAGHPDRAPRHPAVGRRAAAGRHRPCAAAPAPAVAA